MERIFIALGKTGDILSVLPILHHEHLETGRRPKVVVSRAFASTFSGVSYVEPLIYSGDFFDLSGAIRMVKSQGNEAVPLQVFGRDYPLERKTPSFQLDQWLRAGAINHFYDWPLVIDRRNRDREQKLVKSVTGKQPFLLFADYSESAPFADKEALALSLKADFGGTHDLIRLSEVRAESIYDLLGLYHKATALITVDTGHLHLSRAVPTPVIALTRDLPSRWVGAAWHPRFVFACRYADYPRRQGELLGTVGALVRREHREEPEVIATEHPHGYNPTIMANSHLLVYRYHPKNDWKTELALFDGDQTVQIQFPSAFQEFSKEDARLFRFEDKPHISFVLSQAKHGTWNSVVAYGELVNKGTGWSVTNVQVPKIGKNDWSAVEKNWVFFEWKRKLLCLYASAPEQVIYEIAGEKSVSTFRTRCPTWTFGPIRGGCLIPHGDQMLRFFHSHTTTGPRDDWIYSIGAALMESQPPFKTLKINPLPVLAGNEKWAHDCRHWKANVAFPGGVMREGNGWKLAYGRNDSECCYARISEKELNL